MAGPSSPTAPTRSPDAIAIYGELSRVATALERMASTMEMSLLGVSAPETTCAHPDDQRVEFGGMGEAAEWHCRRCGHRSAPEGTP